MVNVAFILFLVPLVALGVTVGWLFSVPWFGYLALMLFVAVIAMLGAWLSAIITDIVHSLGNEFNARFPKHDP